MSNKRSQKKSVVWEHFEQTPDGEKAICKHCSSNLDGRTTSGTSHLKRHIEKCSRDRDPAPENKVRKFAITDDKSWEVEVKKAVLAEIPFAPSHCKNAYYSLNWPIKMDIEESIHAYYEGEKEKLVTEFENSTSKVSFTIDIMEEAGYLSITAHLINNEFNLVHKIIGFMKIPSQTSIESAIQSCISGWRLEEKSFTITYIPNLARIMQELLLFDISFTQSCFKQYIASPFNVILLHLFQLEHANILKFVDSVVSMERNRDELNQISKEHGLPPINVSMLTKPILSMTDHNSMISIVQYAFRYKEVFRQYAPREGGQMCLSKINWERVELLLNTCKLLDNVTNGVSSFKNPSIHLLIRYIIKIREIISNTEIGSIVVRIRGSNYPINFELALLEIIVRSKIICPACVLDPRYKLYPFEYIEEIDQLEITKRIREKLYRELKELFGEYAKGETNHTSPPHIGSTSTTNTQYDDSSINASHPVGHVQNASGFSMYMLQKQKMKPKTSELDEYLREEVVEGTDEDFDLLAWWKENKSRYPVLSRMTRDVLAVPATIYDVREHITTDLRRLGEVDPQLVEAVILCKDWIISSSQSPAPAGQRVKGEHARRQKAGSLKKEPHANPHRVRKRGNKLNGIELATLEYIRQNIKSEEVIVCMYSHASASVIEENCLLKERTLTVEKMACLLKTDNSDGSWLSDEIMDCYIRVIKHGRDEKRKVIIEDTLAYQWLIGRGNGKDKVHESSNRTWNHIKLRPKYLQSEMVIMPVNPSGKHWYVIAINFRKKEFQILDSLRSMNNYDEYQVAAFNLGTGIQVCVDASINQPEKMCSQWKKSSEIVKWPVKIIASVPQQEDLVSCGVFALKYIQFWNGEELEQGFYDADVDYHRKRMANEIIFSVLNKKKTAQDSIIQLSMES